MILENTRENVETGRPGPRPLLDRRALYLQIRDTIAREIASGALPNGMYLANEFELSRNYGVSIGTIRKAVDLLVEDQLLLRQPGRGTMVSDRRWARARTRLDRLRYAESGDPLHWQYEIVKYEIAAAPAVVAARLGLNDGEAVHMIERKRQAARQISALDSIWAPASILGRDRLNLGDHGSVLAAAHARGIKLGEIVDTICCGISEAAENDQSAGVGARSLLKLCRTVRDEARTVVEYRESLIQGPVIYQSAGG